MAQLFQEPLKLALSKKPITNSTVVRNGITVDFSSRYGTEDTLSALSLKYCRRSAHRLTAFFLFGVVTLTALSGISLAEVAPNYERLADAIYKAEGGRKASVPYGIMFKGCDWEHEAYCRRICINTLRNNFKRWIAAGSKNDYLEFLGNRYAPASAHPLNHNWIPNVRRLYGK